jgi:hypothetical protein
MADTKSQWSYFSSKSFTLDNFISVLAKDEKILKDLMLSGWGNPPSMVCVGWEVRTSASQMIPALHLCAKNRLMTAMQLT